MRVLLDFHHHALAESYALTLGDRLGYDIWFPFGMEWFDEGIWQFEKEWHGDRVARQYLEGIWGDYRGAAEVRKPDPRHPDRWLRGISLKAARDSEWDLVISSLPHNDVGYHHFAREAGARFGVQVGNAFQDSRWDLADFILSSTTLPGYGPDFLGRPFTFRGVPAVMMHQEFSLGIFRHDWPPARPREVASFVNCFPETPTYPRFTSFAHAHHDEFDFRVYGASGQPGPDEFTAGDISWVPDIADAMRAAGVIWHDKWHGDGYGHVIHNAFAIGRPIIGSRRYYIDKVAAPLWVEGVTAFDIEQPEHIVTDILRRLRDDDDFHWQVSTAAAARFRKIVDFEQEAEAVRRLLEA